MSRSFSVWLDGFLDGLTAAGLFGGLRRPGAPTEFVDSRGVDEFVKSGEYASTVSRFTGPVAEGDRQRVPRPEVASAKYMSGHR